MVPKPPWALSTTLVLACLALVVAMGGCSALSDDSASGRTMTVEFRKARSFYPESKVKIMGMDVGRVGRVDNLGDRIRATFRLEEDVPLPRGVRASIVPINLIGERNLVLHPAWKPGQPKETSDHIPLARTHVPVEVDDALESFTEFSEALDPTTMRSVVKKNAQTLNGNGRDFNATLEQSGRLIENVAGQDQELIQVARNLRRLAGVVRGREQVLGHLVRDFSTATKVLSDERGEVQDLARGLVDLTRNSRKLVDKYKGQLPADLAVLTQVALVLNTNAKSLAKALHAAPILSDAYVNAYNREYNVLRVRVNSDPWLRSWLKAAMNSDNAPCPTPGDSSNCPWMKKGGN